MILVDQCKTALRWARIYTRDLDRHDGIRAASAMAFHAFFSLVPLVAITGWAVHKFTQVRESFLQPVIFLAPGSIGKLADAEFMRLSGTGDALLPALSVFGFLWLATGGVAAAMRVFERIFEAPRRPWGHRRITAFGFVLLSVALIAPGGWIAIVAAREGGVVATVIGFAAPVVALWILVGLFFRYGTRRSEGDRRRGFRGAAVTLILWVAESALFSWFVAEIARYTQFYGGLATVAVLLAWLWLMSFSLLIGGEVNARLEGIRTREAVTP
jgi:membrane protein